MTDYKYQIEKQVAEEEINFKFNRITPQEQKEIYDRYDKLKEESKWFTDRYTDFYKSFSKYYSNIKSSIREDVFNMLYFIKLCEATSMYDKVGNTYYNAKKVLGLFPYNDEI